MARHAISTNLNLDKRIDELVEAEPDVLNIATFELGKLRETTTYGGKI